MNRTQRENLWNNKVKVPFSITSPCISHFYGMTIFTRLRTLISLAQAFNVPGPTFRQIAEMHVIYVYVVIFLSFGCIAKILGPCYVLKA